MDMKVISTKGAPSAIGPYSQAVMIGDVLYSSGQIALRADGTLNDGDIQIQTHQVMKNLLAVLEEAGLTFSNVVKTTIFLADMDDFSLMNEVYESYLSEPFPARSTVAVKTLPKNVKVEIEVVAFKR
jgi:2-iminobutanoate/2-iminopropanoate deaminase